jgi:hypothetical protein
MALRRAALALSFAAAALAAARCDTTSCIDRNADVGTLCLPDTVQAGRTFQIEVREACGLCSTQPQCHATLLDGEVRVDLQAQLCNDGSVNCDTNLCLERIVRCTLPSLPSGDWPLVLAGNQVRVLRVREGGSSSCRIPTQ